MAILPDHSLVALGTTHPTPGLKIVPAEQATVPFSERSLHFGDSVYEVTRTYHVGNRRVIFDLDLHLQRMKRSAEIARFRDFPDPVHLKSSIEATVHEWFKQFESHFAPGPTDVYIRWFVSRGLSDTLLNPLIAKDQRFYIYVRRLEPNPPFQKGMNYILSHMIRNSPRALPPQMKSGNYLNNLLALEEAKVRGADDAIMLSADGFITEGTTNNVYCVKDGVISTAPVSLGILEGLVRGRILNLCSELGIPLKERLITQKEFETADELFMSSSTREIQAITTLDGISRGAPGPVTSRLAQALSQKIQDLCLQQISK